MSRVGQDGRIGRVAAVLDRCARAARPLRFSEVRQSLGGLPASTVARLLHSLCANGILDASDGAYAPTRRVAAWGRAIPRTPDLGHAATDALADISRTFGGTAILLSRQGRRVASIAKCQHEDAPALMDIGHVFRPSVTYIAGVLFVDPPRTGLVRYAKEQISLVGQPGSLVASGLIDMVRSYHGDGLYRDRGMRPGQMRFGVPIRRNGRTVAAVALAIPGQASVDAETRIMDDLLRLAGRLESVRP